MRTALSAALASLVAVACAHDRDRSPPPATVTGAPVPAAPAPASSPEPGEYQSGTVPERTWGTGGVAEPHAGSSASPPEEATPKEETLRDSGAPPPRDWRNPSPDYSH